MANKRKPISFPELDQMEPRTEPRGRRAILRSVEEVEAEEQMLDIQNAGVPALWQTGNTAIQHSRSPENQETSIPASQDVGAPNRQEETSSEVPESLSANNRARYTKVTYRLSPDAIDAIEEAKSILRRKYKLKVSLEEIAEEAIIAVCCDLLENQDASMLVNKISSKQAKQKAGKIKTAPR
jgi:hypothetical protein